MKLMNYDLSKKRLFTECNKIKINSKYLFMMN